MSDQKLYKLLSGLSQGIIKEHKALSSLYISEIQFAHLLEVENQNKEIWAGRPNGSSSSSSSGSAETRRNYIYSTVCH